MKKVSAIVTTYNSEKSLLRVINSINTQQGINTEFTVELIVVDDCSKDNTRAILEANNIPYLSTPKNSGGPNAGRNIGLKAATGDYICIVDHDDEWHPNKVQSLLPHFDRAAIVTSGYTVVDDSTGKTTHRVTPCPTPNNTLFYDTNVTFKARLTKSLTGQLTYLGSIIYKAELKNVLFEEQYGVVDFDWLLKLFHNQASVEVCQSLYNRHVEGSNLSLNEGYRIKDFNYSLDTIKQYAAQYPKEAAIAYKRIHGSMGRYYYQVGNMPKARQYFAKSSLNWKTILYYLTTFAGAKFVKKRFNVFG